MRAQRLKEFDAVVHVRGGYEDGEDEVSVFTVQDACVMGDVGKTAGFVRGFLGGVGIHQKFLVLLAKEDGDRSFAKIYQTP